MFRRVIRQNETDFVVDILMDASGSQRDRQSQVALQAFIISEALSNVQIPHRVMSFCTFWDYTVIPHLPITGMVWPSGQRQIPCCNGKRKIKS